MTPLIWSRRGAALPMAILWSMLLVVGLLAGLSRLSAERRTQADADAAVDAYALARAGMDRYVETVTGQPGASLDTTLAGLPGGSVAISVRRLRAGSGSVRALYLVRAHATHSTAVRYDALTGSAERSITQFMQWVPGSMNVTAAWASIPGLKKMGPAGTISGYDECGVAPPVAGVSVPVTSASGGPGYNQNGGGAPVPTGVPPIEYPGTTPTTMAPTVTIDWNGIVNGGALPAQFNLTSSSGWPSSFTNWPSIYVDNPTNTLQLNNPHSGRGLLVVRGDLKLTGGFSWDGVILVGGNLEVPGASDISGAIISGLNVKLGMSVDDADAGPGTKTFRYNSCHVASALAGLGGLVPISNSVADNWPVY